MATIKLQGNASGSGSVTLTAPNTNSARTITLPDEDVDLGNVGGGAAVTSCINGTGTVSLQTSKGVSSVTDIAAGKYQFNFSSNFNTATYYADGTISYQDSSHWSYLSNNYTGGNMDHTRTTAHCKVGSYNTSYVDAPSVGLLASV